MLLLFTFIVVLLVFLLLTVAIVATRAAELSATPALQSGHQYMVIAAALAWTSLAVLIVAVLVAVFAGGFSTVDVSPQLLAKANPTTADLIKGYQAEQALSVGATTQIIVLVILVFLVLVILAVGVLGVLGASRLTNTPAYTYAVVTAVMGVGGVGLLIVAIISYLSARHARANRLQAVKEFEARAERSIAAAAGSTGEVIRVEPIIQP